MRSEQAKHEVRPAAEFNPYAPGYDADPSAELDRLRGQAPVQYWEKGRGWLVFRYEEALAVLRDNKRFSANRADWEFHSVLGTAALIPELAEFMKTSLFALSGANHARVRKLVSPAFSPRAIERLRPEIQALVDEVLDAAAVHGTVNVARDIAELIPGRVMSSMLKIPKAREALFMRFTRACIKNFLPGLVEPSEVEALRQDIREGIALIHDTIEERRREPLPEDILTTLIQTEEQGERLNTRELMSLVSALLVGGFETTAHLICFTTYNLLERPELLARVRAEPELLKSVIEEVLRFDNFWKAGIVRYALEDVELGGVTLKKGQMVLLMIGSALRDEQAFPQAAVFDVSRDLGPSVAFGHGIHYCLGASLARLEVQLTVGTLVRRFPEARLLRPPVFGPHPVIRKMESLDVQLRAEVKA